MKLFKTSHMSEETRYSIRIVLIILSIPVIFFCLDFFLSGGGDQPVPVTQEKRVIVKEVQRPPAAKPPSKEVMATVQEALKNKNYSTAYLEISRMPPDSAEYKELSKTLASEKEKQKKERPGVRKQGPPETLHYYDEATPRDHNSDWIYVYFTEQAGTFWPRLTIQQVAKEPLRITGYRITADGKSFTIPVSSMKSERQKAITAVWFDAPLDHQLAAVAQAVAKAKKAEISYSGPSGSQSRTISEDEKKGLNRILDAYAALGGNLSFFQGETKAKATKK